MTKSQPIIQSQQPPQESGYTPISISCIFIGSGNFKNVTKTFSCKRSYRTHASDCDTIDTAFTLEKTKREIQQYRLILEPGCIITDKTGRYICSSIAYTERPRHPILHAKYIGPIS